MTLICQQLSSYFWIKTKCKEKPCRSLFQLVRRFVNVVLCTWAYFNRLLVIVCLCHDIITITIHRIIFLLSFSLFSSSSLQSFSFLFTIKIFLLCSDDVRWTCIHACMCMSKACSACTIVCHSAIRIIYSSEEIMLLCEQLNNLYSRFLIIDRMYNESAKERRTLEKEQWELIWGSHRFSKLFTYSITHISLFYWHICLWLVGSMILKNIKSRSCFI